MFKFAASTLLLGLSCSPALASLPGQPLDCSDWVFLDPGLRCEEWMSDSNNSPWALFQPNNAKVVDNTGSLLRIDFVSFEGCGFIDLRRTRLVRFDGIQEHVLAYVEDRCVPGGNVDTMRSMSNNRMKFDPITGTVLIPVNAATSPNQQVVRELIVAIKGLPSTFEILQTFTPTASELGFHVPAIPEGLQFADRFDTYVGDLAAVGDWSQLQPLQCAYPAIAPSVGDFLTVADTTPTPAVGQGLYFVTAATFQGQTRFGRQSVGGVLSGRNPATLPVCQ